MCELESLIDSQSSTKSSRQASMFLLLFAFIDFSVSLAISKFKSSKQELEQKEQGQAWKEYAESIPSNSIFFFVASLIIQANAPAGYLVALQFVYWGIAMQFVRVSYLKPDLIGGKVKLIAFGVQSLFVLVLLIMACVDSWCKSVI